MSATSPGTVEHPDEYLRVQEVCQAKGWKLPWVAEQVGIRYGRLYHILHRRYGYPRPEGFEERLARVLGVPVHMIFPPEADEQEQPQ